MTVCSLMESTAFCVLDSLLHLPWKVANARRSISVWSLVTFTQPLSAGRIFSCCIQHFSFQIKYLKLREDGSYCLSSPSWPDPDLEIERRSSGFQSRAALKVLKCTCKIPCPLNLLREWIYFGKTEQLHTRKKRMHSDYTPFIASWNSPAGDSEFLLRSRGRDFLLMVRLAPPHSHKHCIIYEEKEVNTTFISLWGRGPVILLLLLIFPINILSWKNKQKTPCTDYHLLFRRWAHAC